MNLMLQEDWKDKVFELYNFICNNNNEDDQIFMAMNFGPAHIVWEDHNFDSASIQWCLDNFEYYKSDHSEENLKRVKWSLEGLLLLLPKYEDCL